MKKDELVQQFFDVLATDNLDKISEFLEAYSEIESVLVKQMQAAGFEPDTKNGWERLKQRLIDDGIWRDE